MYKINNNKYKILINFHNNIKFNPFFNINFFSYTKKKSMEKKLGIIFAMFLVGIMNIHNNKLVHDA